MSSRFDKKRNVWIFEHLDENGGYYLEFTPTQLRRMERGLKMAALKRKPKEVKVKRVNKTPGQK